jgi:excisionase family DNA binding protein
MGLNDTYIDPLDQIAGQFVTTRQAADILNVPIYMVTQWCSLGLIASRRLGGRYRIPKWVIRNLRHVSTPTTIQDKPFVTLAEAAPILNVRPDVLRRWCQKGKIPCRRVGNRYELSQRTLQMLMETFSEHQHEPDYFSPRWFPGL